MRLLMVTHFYESHGGGIERVAGHLCRHLAAQMPQGEGATVTWAASAQDPAPDLPGVAVLPLPCINPTEALTGLPMPIPGWRGVVALWRAVGAADAVIIHDSLYVTSILAMKMAFVRRRRRVVIQHIAAIPFAGRVMRGVMALANWCVTRPMLWAANEVLFISDVVRRALLGDPAWRSYRLLFNGVDGAVFRPDGATIDLPGTRRLLFVGRFVPKKGLAILRALAAQRPDWTVLMAGAGPIDPTGWGLANVHVLGPRTPGQLAALYRSVANSAGALVLPSVGEGYPLVIQEAMACGLPVVCGAPADRADPAAARLWEGRGLRGVAVDPGDPAGSARAWVTAIEALTPTPAERANMAAFAAARYDWAAMARGVLTAAG